MTAFLRSYHAFDQPIGDVDEWVYTVPAFRALREAEALDFRAPITIITGENGVGKSTLLEGIAVSCGFNDQGGPFGAPPTGRDNPLRAVAGVTKGPRAMEGYFLRAESHFNVASEYGNNAPGGVPMFLSRGRPCTQEAASGVAVDLDVGRG